MPNLKGPAKDSPLSHYAEILAIDADPCYLIDINGRVQFCNDIASSLCPPEQLEALLETTAFSPSLPELLRQAAPSVTLSITGNGLRFRASRIGPRTGPGEVMLLRRIPPADTPQIQRSHQARQRSDRRFRQFLNASEDGIGSVAENGQITMANAAMARLLGVEDPIGRCLFNHLHFAADPNIPTADTPEALMLHLARAPLHGLVQINGPDRQEVAITTTPVEDQNFRQFVVVIRNVEAQVAYSEALAKSQYLEAARDIAQANEQTKTQLMATFSHEMRAPLGAVVTASDLLLHEDALAEEHRKLLEVIRGSAETALDQINDTLEHVRLDLRPLKDHPVSRFSPQEVLTKLARQNRIAAEAKGLSLVLNIAPDAAVQVAGYHHLFHRIVQNLLSNAVKYTETGTITLTCLRETPTDATGTPLAGKADFRIIVEDTGRGMSDTQLARMFTPFETGAKSFDTLARSAGLGLSIVKRALDAMSGTFDVRSTLNQGSRFEIGLRFDLAAGVDQTPVGGLAGDSAIRHARFLVVDDNPLNLKLMCQLLESEGCQAFAATGGLDALDIAKHEDLDAVLMDIGMPDIDGLEATRRLRRDLQLAQLPVFGLTGFSDPDIKERAELAGMNHVYTKPLRRVQLQEVMHRISELATAPTPVAEALRPIRGAVLRKSISSQIAKISGDNWPVFVHHLHKECAGILDQIQRSTEAGSPDLIPDLARRGMTTADTVGANALYQVFLEFEDLEKQGSAVVTAPQIQRAKQVLEETKLALALL